MVDRHMKEKKSRKGSQAMEEELWYADVLVRSQSSSVIRHIHICVMELAECLDSAMCIDKYVMGLFATQTVSCQDLCLHCHQSLHDYLSVFKHEMLTRYRADVVSHHVNWFTSLFNPFLFLPLAVKESYMRWIVLVKNQGEDMPPPCTVLTVGRNGAYEDEMRQCHWRRS